MACTHHTVLITIGAMWSILWVSPSESQTASFPPQAHDLTYGYTAFSGLNPAEQRATARLFTEELFVLTGDRERDGYLLPKQFDGFSTSSHCRATEFSNDVLWATSDAFLRTESQSRSDGAEQQTTAGVGTPATPIGVGTPTGTGASTTIRNALAYGSSESSQEAAINARSGRTYSFKAEQYQRSYTVFMDYDSFTADDWTTALLDACSALGQSPTDAEVMHFFREIGSHLLEEATLGQLCTSSVYMEEGQKYSDYTDFRTEGAQNEVAVVWWSSTSSSSATSQSGVSQQSQFSYRLSDRRCFGATAEGSACGLPATTNTPAILSATYRDLWTLDIPTLSAGAKAAMQSVADRIFEEGVSCGVGFCGGKGACAPNEAWWRSSDAFESYSQLFKRKEPSNQDPTEDPCFCFHGWEGYKCEDTVQEICRQRQCNGHGECPQGLYRDDLSAAAAAPCTCDHGYDGATCDERRVFFVRVSEPEYNHLYWRMQNPESVPGAWMTLLQGFTGIDHFKAVALNNLAYEAHAICLHNTDYCLHAQGGLREAAYIGADKGVAHARTDPAYQWRFRTENEKTIICAATKDLCMHTWGGTELRRFIRLHNGHDYATRHTNSQYLFFDV